MQGERRERRQGASSGSTGSGASSTSVGSELLERRGSGGSEQRKRLVVAWCCGSGASGRSEHQRKQTRNQSIMFFQFHALFSTYEGNQSASSDGSKCSNAIETQSPAQLVLRVKPAST
jgi:hypothetical protein